MGGLQIFLLILKLARMAFDWLKKQEYISEGMHRQAIRSLEAVNAQVKIAQAHGAKWRSMSHDERMQLLQEAGDFRD
jgi:acyl-CoA reductase-like NAD-dependent aldehyde dehydrogenase